MDNLTRAKELLKSAKTLFKKENMTGVAGLANQAVESATMHLTTKTNGHAHISHSKRRKRTEVLLQISKKTLKNLWNARNVDFYGNERVYSKQKELDKKTILESIEKAEHLIKQIEKVTEKPKKISAYHQ